MTDPTRFELDERQRAMLAEMGIRLWWPQAAQTVPTAPPEAIAPPRLEPAPASPSIVTAPSGVEAMDWDTLQASVAQCRACGLCTNRKNTVFGVGDRRARWMVIGEAPGENEDLQGEPFVGQAGRLLDNMLAAIGLSRQAEDRPDGLGGVYIANTLKCRPPGNRNPEPQELLACAPSLMRQVALVQPALILAMGRFAVQSLLQTAEPIGKLRGRLHRYQGVPVVVTYHPAYLLRNPADKAKAWADLCLAVRTDQTGAAA
ncbi:MAG: uracil-DNA glycosylase [Limnohabitans sp.]